VIQAAANLAEQGEILCRHLGIPIHARPAGESTLADPSALLPLAEIERRHILRVYDATARNKTHTAKVLGIGAQTLHRKLKAYGVP
jgi:Nif-specific regulatory protein